MINARTEREPIISATGLTKSFWRSTARKGVGGTLRGLVSRDGESVDAVRDVTFDIAPGEVVGLIGPNGAGKSTTIKMLTGILVPSSGAAKVAGYVPWDQRRQLAARIGVVFGQKTQLWWDLPLSESLDLLQYIYKVPADRFAASLAHAKELLELEPFLSTPVRQLSLGQRMRGDLAAALLHEPPILYLDEPTIGLDLVAKQRIRTFLAEINRTRDVTILLTTHDLADIEMLCHRIIVIDHGRVVHDGPLAGLRDRYATTRELTVDYFTDIALPELPLGGPVSLVEHNGARARVSFEKARIGAPDVLAQLSTFGTIQDMHMSEPSIEDIIERLYASASS